MVKHEALCNSSKEGWFLHLHGSPLFITDKESGPKKIPRAKLAEYRGHDSVHLVLTDIDSKPSVIENSEILRAYWKIFEKLVASSGEIILFGYGGGDKHLNSLLARTSDEQRIRIICRQGSSNAEKWMERFTPKNADCISIIPLNNILEFSDW